MIKTIFPSWLLLSILLCGCSNLLAEKSTPEKIGWKPEDFFADPLVIKLCHAIDDNNLEEIQSLIDAGVDLNKKGKGNNTPLLWAFFDNKPKRFELLLKNGANPNILTTDDLGLRGVIPKGSAIVHLTAKSKFPELFELAMKHGGNPDLADKIRDHTPIFYVIAGAYGQTLKKKRVQLLIDAKANLSYVSKKTEQTPTSIALSYGAQYKIAMMLLKAGSDYNSFFPNHRSKLIHKVLREKRLTQNSTPEVKAELQEIIDWLEAHGEDFDKAQEDLDRWRSWGGTPLMIKALADKEVAERLAREKSEREDKPQ